LTTAASPWINPFTTGIMSDLFDRVAHSAAHLIPLIGAAPRRAIILGTGMAGCIQRLVPKLEIDYRDIPDFVPTTVDSHPGKLVLADWSGVPVIILSGRLHYYEGYSLREVTFPVRVLSAMGIRELWIANASGSVNPEFPEGCIAVLKDHVNFHPENPLRGLSDPRLGERFPDMSRVYDEGLRRHAEFCCNKLSIPYREGIYFGLQGPSLETPAECRMIRLLGADLIGMSSVPEAIVARQCGMRLLAISLVANVSAPGASAPETSLASVLASMERHTPRMFDLMECMLTNVRVG
jgi:purine-nucleoside phosphorylase